MLCVLNTGREGGFSDCNDWLKITWGSYVCYWGDGWRIQIIFPNNHKVLPSFSKTKAEASSSRYGCKQTKVQRGNFVLWAQINF